MFKMEKAGILTFHRASNYGAVLQAFALQKTIENLGYRSEIIDYRSHAIEIAHNPLYFDKKYGVKGILAAPIKIIKFRIFSEFRKKHLRLSKRVDTRTIGNIISDYSVLITGSDQVWNGYISGQDVNYFLPFKSPVNKYSYAASLGDSYDTSWTKDILAKFGTGFSTISLREESAKEFVSDVTGKECRIDIDPTLLLSKNEWLEIAQKPKISDPYILIYTLALTTDIIQAAKEMSIKTGMKIVYLSNSFSRDRDIRKTRFSTPEEFVGWLSEADYIFTNSFHGTAFSIIMNKPFFISKNAILGVNKRSADLIRLLEIEDRVISEKNDINHVRPIDWTKTNFLLSKNVRNAKDYIVSMFCDEVPRSDHE